MWLREMLQRALEGWLGWGFQWWRFHKSLPISGQKFFWWWTIWVCTIWGYPYCHKQHHGPLSKPNKLGFITLRLDGIISLVCFWYLTWVSRCWFTSPQEKCHPHCSLFSNSSEAKVSGGQCLPKSASFVSLYMIFILCLQGSNLPAFMDETTLG